MATLFPGEVQAVHVVYDTAKLDNLVEEYEKLHSNLTDLLDDYTSKKRRHKKIKRKQARRRPGPSSNPDPDPDPAASPQEGPAQAGAAQPGAARAGRPGLPANPALTMCARSRPLAATRVRRRGPCLVGTAGLCARGAEERRAGTRVASETAALGEPAAAGWPAGSGMVGSLARAAADAGGAGRRCASWALSTAPGAARSTASAP